MSLMFFYGTLRQGFYNHNRLGLNDPSKATFIGKASLPDHGILLRGILPYAVRAEGSHLEGEVYEVHDPVLSGWIERMEQGAGYEAKEVTVFGTDTESQYIVDFYLGDMAPRSGEKIHSVYDVDEARV